MNFLRRVVWPAFALLIAMTVITGAVYPAVVTAIAQVAFPNQADGSFITTKDGRVIGSSLIGQVFDQPQYFWGRPSDAGAGYDGTSSAGSNLGPTDPRLVGFVPGTNTVGLDGATSATNPFASPTDPYCVPTDPDGSAVISPSEGQAYAMNPDGTYVCYPNTVFERAITYRQLNGLAADAAVPIDAITTSASGLDPDISPQTAETQVARVAAARNLTPDAVRAVVAKHTQQPLFGFLGEPRVNVLLTNLDLDGLLQ